MKRAVYYGATSLDGYLSDPDDGLDWLLGYEGTYAGSDADPSPMGEGGGYERFYEGVGALVSGSTTYEWLLDHLDEAGGGKWPYSGKPYWVLSSRELAMPPGDGVDVRVVNGDVADLYGDMVASAGERDLWLVGGGNLAAQFDEAGLIGELIVTVVPVLLGDGKPLFDRPPSAPFELVGVRPNANGMVELRYRR